MKKWLLIGLLLTGFAMASDKIEHPCTVKGGGVTAGYLCAVNKMDIADKELNRTYLEALKRVKEEETALRKTWEKTDLVKPFRAAQRAWLTFRDAQCRFSGLSSTPSPWQAVQIEECKVRMTLERIAYFKAVYVG
ncbi:MULTISPECIES: lysozyme inhibitor LprI family protein [unclassified Vibrio]|uniref:lysozyme inhibitor LprI family protein n=1 Tax=unclassified Vibrio TaxID=2614977 RepID=UPI003075B172